MKKLFEKIWAFVENMFSTIEKKVEKLIPLATGIVEGVKNALENNKVLSVIEIIKFMIPGDTDDKIIDKAIKITQEYIPKIALQLGIIKSISGIENVNDQMIAVVNALKEANDEQKSDYWHELAAYVLKKLADGKLTLGEAGSIVEYHYQNYVKVKNE
jgi:hypothetical protein